MGINSELSHITLNIFYQCKINTTIGNVDCTVSCMCSISIAYCQRRSCRYHHAQCNVSRVKALLQHGKGLEPGERKWCFILQAGLFLKGEVHLPFEQEVCRVPAIPVKTRISRAKNETLALECAVCHSACHSGYQLQTRKVRQAYL